MAAINEMLRVYLDEYKNAIKTVFYMDVDTRTHVFNPDGRYDLITLIDEFSPSEFVEKVKAYNNRPKTGEVFADSFNAKIIRKVLWSDENRVNYIFYDETGDKWVDSSSIDYFKGHNKKINETTEDFNKLFSELSKNQKIERKK